jgi:hypothetical protein
MLTPQTKDCSQNELEFIHPDLAEGEVFFTNSNAVGFESISLISKRKGSIPYDGQGNVLAPSKEWFPVFLKQEELNESLLSLGKLRRRFREGK